MMKRETYREQLYPLHIELLKLQRHLAATGRRLAVLFEGRDAAGKGGAIKTLVKHLNPRGCRVVALSRPTERERGQWYFQRYVAHLPTAGEIAVFDRSWYNRSGVEWVNGFCTFEEHRAFLESVAGFEETLVQDGLLLRKYWFSIDRNEQKRRLDERRTNPLKQWKMTPLDEKAQAQWDAYSEARDETFRHSDRDAAPWRVVEANDKRAARVAMIRDLLASLDYEEKDMEGMVDPSPLVHRVNGGDNGRSEKAVHR